MVMVTGITCGAAVTAITTVGTEAADIIMDGTRADIADGIHNMRSRPPQGWGGHVYLGMLFNEQDSLVSHRVLHGVRSLQQVPLRSGRQVLCRRVRRI